MRCTFSAPRRSCRMAATVVGARLGVQQDPQSGTVEERQMAEVDDQVLVGSAVTLDQRGQIRGCRRVEAPYSRLIAADGVRSSVAVSGEVMASPVAVFVDVRRSRGGRSARRTTGSGTL